MENGCQHFSNVHSSRLHWKCKYFAVKDKAPIVGKNSLFHMIMLCPNTCAVISFEMLK